MRSLRKTVSLCTLHLFLATLILGPSVARAGWAPAMPGPQPDTTFGALDVATHQQLTLPYMSKLHGVSGVFYADVYSNGTAFDIVLIDDANGGDICEIHASGDDMYYEQWNTETCDPNHIFLVLSLVFQDQLEDSLVAQWWEANGPGFGVGGGGGDPNPGVDPSYGREDGGDSETSNCMGAIALNCGLTFVGGLGVVLAATAALTPVGGAAVAVITGAAVGVACGSAIYNDCIDNIIQMYLEVVEVVTTVGAGQDLVVDFDALIDYLESLLEGGFVVEGLDPSDLVSAGSGFAVTLTQPDNFHGQRTLGGVPRSLLR